jgi:hypothetical protein
MNILKSFLMVLFFSSIMYAQGFGIYGGYGYYNYNAEGFNNYIDVYNKNHPLLTTKMEHFGTSPGSIFGVTFEFGDYGETIIAIRVETTSNSEAHTAMAPEMNDFVRREYALSLSGVKLGTSVFLPFDEVFSWTINSYLGYHTLTLSNNYSEPGGFKKSQELGGTGISWNVFTGLRINLTSFFSIDGNVGFNICSIPRLSFDDGLLLQRSENDNTEMDNFIKGYGLILNIQGTIKIPFEMSDL